MVSVGAALPGCGSGHSLLQTKVRGQESLDDRKPFPDHHAVTGTGSLVKLVLMVWV